MANKRVKIYERVQIHRGRWTDRAVTIPKLRSDGTLYLKDEREGKFRVSWYEGTKKQWHPTTCRTLGEALKVKDDKQWFLKNQNRPGVQDPTLPDVRLPISTSVDLYIDSLTRSKRTKIAYGHAVRQFEAWNASLKNGSRKTFVEEIDKAHLARLFDYLVDDEPENCPYTAALKLLRVNAFIRTTLKLDPGKGPIKKSDYRRELKSGQDRPQIYTRDELKLLFEAMTPEEHLLFEVFLKTGFRKREVMFLEEDDLIVDTLAPGRVKRQMRVTNKPHLGFMTKNGKTRYVRIDRDLMDRLLALKATQRPSRLLFGTANGLPDYHFLDTLRSIARRAGIEPSRCWLHKFRSTCATNWLRSKRLGGEGHDMGLVREWLGHDDYKSIERYFAIAREEEMIEADEPAQAPQNCGTENCAFLTTCFGCHFEKAEVRSKFADGSQIVYCPRCGELACEDGGNRTVIRKIACSS
ncbi:MAG: site-specific integrase [Candidatus Acidiferrales bacterium]